jgi:hypothetical protein
MFVDVKYDGRNSIIHWRYIEKSYMRFAKVIRIRTSIGKSKYAMVGFSQRNVATAIFFLKKSEQKGYGQKCGKQE